MKKVMIPTCMFPFVVDVNGKRYTYPAGTEQEVPDEVALIIEGHNYHHKPQPEPIAPPFGAGDAILERVAAVEKRLSDLLYKAITITAFTAKDTATGASTLEIGTKVTNVTFAWAFSKDPKTVTFNGKAMPVNATGTKLDATVTGNTSWPLAATDERDTEAKGSAGLTFLNGVYYGVLGKGAEVDSAAILSMSKKLQSGRKVDFTVSPGAGKRPAYALPANGYGTPTFKIGGFEYEWEKIATIDFTNASGHTESYDVWMHSQDVTGSVTINVT